MIAPDIVLQEARYLRDKIVLGILAYKASGDILCADLPSSPFALNMKGKTLCIPTAKHINQLPIWGV